MSASGLDVLCVSCYSPNVTSEDPDESFEWFVKFRAGSKTYTYVNRTIGQMKAIIQNSYAKTGSLPYRVWVLVDDEMVIVDITAAPQKEEAAA